MLEAAREACQPEIRTGGIDIGMIVSGQCNMQQSRNEMKIAHYQYNELSSNFIASAFKSNCIQTLGLVEIASPMHLVQC